MLHGQWDIGWAKAIGFKCLVCYLHNSCMAGRNFTVYRDNKGVVEGWQNGRSHNYFVNKVFKASIPSSASPTHNILSKLFMSPAALTPPMVPLKAFTHLPVNSSQSSACPLNWISSSLTHSCLPPPPSSSSFRKDSPQQPKNALSMLTGSLRKHVITPWFLHQAAPQLLP